MSSVHIEFEFSDGSTDSSEFEARDTLLADIDAYAEDVVSDKNSDLEEGADEIELVGYTVLDSETDFADQCGPGDFADLDAWGEYCERVEEHGEAYVLRYNDIGDHNFDDEYHGCWRSFEDFAEHIFDDCMDCPDNLKQYIDYEKFAGDLHHDYSEYDGREGVHVFRC